ncbi:MAG: SNF2-related protein [Polyangiales bacterium]
MTPNQSKEAEQRMAATQLAHKHEIDTPLADSPGPDESISAVVGRMSDRAIQRIVGGNAFLRGRIYARRKVVDGLCTENIRASARMMVRGASEPYLTQIELNRGRIISRCTCPGWRGPTSHCKHVAALLVALRDQQRPARSATETQQRSSHEGKQDERRAGSQNTAHAAAPAPAPATTPSGKRRRARRRRRGDKQEANATVEVLPPKSLTRARGGKKGEARGGLEAWLPQDADTQSYDFAYRLQVRSASISVTPVLGDSRRAVPVIDALSGFHTVGAAHRSIFRALARHTTRQQPASAEFRAEEAAEVLSLLRGHKVLLEPACMELRFSDEVLQPRLELELMGPQSLRMRVVFAAGNQGRRFGLSSGAWFEGTPGWHLDTTEGVARPVAESVTPAWLQRLYRSPSLVQPLDALPQLLTDFIPRVAASLSTDLPDLSAVADVIDAPPQLQLVAEGDLIDAEVRLRTVYDGATFPVPVHQMPAPLGFLPPRRGETRPRVVRREVGTEMAAVQTLLDVGLTPLPEVEALQAHGEDAIQFWTEGLGSLPETWDRFVPEGLVDVTIRDETVQPRMQVSSGVDWLSLDMQFAAGPIAVSEEELRRCLESGRRLVQLEDGSYAPVDVSQVGTILERMTELMVRSDGRKLPLSQAGRVQDLLRLVGHSKVDTGVRKLFDQLANIDHIPPVAKPRNLKAALRPYQKEGFSWLVFVHELGSGGVLADDMGLGKTLQTIALLLWARNKHKKAGNLVVAPTSVVPNWQREIAKFAPSLSTHLWHGADRQQQADAVSEADVVITSYALLRRDEAFLSSLGFRYVILDEAQHIKNPLSATAKAAKAVKSERRLALTGTPIENRLSEIWSIFDFVFPGLLGELRPFEEKFARPIDRGDEESAERLKSTVGPFILRRTKEQVASDLPEKIEQEIIVPLADAQASLYRQVLRQVRQDLLSEVERQGVAKSQIQILAALTRLRQVACDPRLLDVPGDWSDDESGKLSALNEIVAEAAAGGHRVLVFSQFVSMLRLIRAGFDKAGIRYNYLDGSTKDRLERVEDFNADSSQTVFLISLKAGGTGLNLTGADTVVHFDPWWNPAVEDQATDRAHRIGQTRTVNVYRLIARGTVEEKILQLSAKKRALMQTVLSTEGSPLSGLTRNDVDNLFSE